MREFKGIDCKVTVDGDNITIERSLKTIRHVTKFNDILGVKYVAPAFLTNGQLNIQTRTTTHPLTFSKVDDMYFKQLHELIQEKCPNIKDYVSTAKPSTAPCCPKCKSTNIQVMGNDRKAFSLGKAVAGTVLAGGVGSLAGFAGKKGKYDVLCMECGNRFQMK